MRTRKRRLKCSHGSTKRRAQSGNTKDREIYGFDVVVSTIRWYNELHKECFANQFYVDNGKGIYYSINNGYLPNDPKQATRYFIRALGKIPSLISNIEKEKQGFGKRTSRYLKK